MHIHTVLAVAATALIAVTAPSESSAQAGRGRGGAGVRSGPGPTREAFHPAIPRQPVARDGARAAPMVEPFHPASTVPYVRNNNWYAHAAPADARFRLARPFQFGRFALTGPAHVYTLNRVDAAARRIWLPRGEFQIADWDWAVTAPWCWTCDQFVVYPDPDHAGWYLVYDVRMGEYVHAQFLGA